MNVRVFVQFQIKFAFILTFVYVIVQVFVTIGIIYSVVTTTPVYCNSNAIFLFLVGAIFVLCGMLHPLELTTLFCGIVYYLTLPTMCMILMIYSICNLNVVSWGTRDAGQVDEDGDTSHTLDFTDLRLGCCSMTGSYDVYEIQERRRQQWQNQTTG